VGIQRIGHWLGEPVTHLPDTIKQIIFDHFTVVEHDHDISILSAPSLTVAFFYFKTGRQQTQLEMAFKICEHLNKQLVVIHHGLLTPHSPWIHVTKASIDLSRQGFSERKLHELLLALSTQSDLPNRRGSRGLQIPPVKPQLYDRPLFDILHYIDHNLNKPLRENEISTYFHYSPSYFSTLFRQTMGIGFKAYVCNKRIAKAKEMLKANQHANISQIAYECGYRDVSYFSRLFKKITGVTPGTYRQQQHP